MFGNRCERLSPQSQIDRRLRWFPQLEKALGFGIRIENCNVCFRAPCRLDFVDLSDCIEIGAIAVLTTIAGMFFTRMMICAVSRVVIYSLRNLCV